MRKLSCVSGIILLSVLSIPSAFAQDNDIVDTAIGAGSFSTLVTAVQAAGLEDALRGEGPFTVFAPTDDAFAALPAETLQFLLDNPDDLQKVLLYHVVSGEVKAETVVGLSSAETLSGKSVSITVVDGTVKIDEATVVATDILASNGVIHVIDTVLIPPADPEPNIVEVATAAGSFNTLITALELTGLDSALMGEGPFTVFAPTDDAFAAVPAETLQFLLDNPDELSKVLLYHVVSGEVKAETVVGLDSAETLSGKSVSITVVDGTVKINDANVIATDIEASNGIIHVIDSVLIPPADAEPNIVEVAAAAGNFDILLTALQLTGLDEALMGDGPFTVFAPTDEAFENLADGVLDSLIADPDTLQSILLYHVADGKLTADQVLSRNQIPMLQGSRAAIKTDSGSAFIENARITATDIMASNGVIHVIDSVILPPVRRGVAYEVTVINATTHHVFTPPVLVSHHSSISPFEPGQPASPGLTRLAEEGDGEDYLDELFPLDQVFEVQRGQDPILPGMRATFIVRASGPSAEISVLGMLASTNDTFFAGTVGAPPVVIVNGARGAATRGVLHAYDAGTEFNSELCAHIPGPPCGNAGSAPEQDPEGFITLSKGIQGVGDLDPINYNWNGPVALIRIRTLN